MALYCGFQSNSSVIWQQLPNQSSSGYGGGDRSWQDGRKHFLGALTLGPATDRRRAWAQTFYSLGHVVHMVQDAGNPAHTRNDGHYPLLNPDSFETWAAKNGTSIINGHAAVFYTGAFTTPADTNAPAPIANLIDTNQYVLTNPSDASTFGLAEVSNSMFFSDGTQSDGFYPHPTLPSSKQDLFDVVVQNMRQYWAGTQVAGLVSSIGRFVAHPRFDAALDDHVLQAHGSELLPRAVGYTATALTYFFRGDMDLVHDWSRAHGYRIRNLGAETMSGMFTLYYDDANGGRHEHVSWSGTIEPDGELEISFRDPSDSNVQPPVGVLPARPGEYVLVFSGDLGDELASAVSAKTVNPGLRGPFCLPRFDETRPDGFPCWSETVVDLLASGPMNSCSEQIITNGAPHELTMTLDKANWDTGASCQKFHGAFGSSNQFRRCPIPVPDPATLPPGGFELRAKGRLESVQVALQNPAALHYRASASWSASVYPIGVEPNHIVREVASGRMFGGAFFQDSPLEFQETVSLPSDKTEIILSFYTRLTAEAGTVTSHVTTDYLCVGAAVDFGP